MDEQRIGNAHRTHALNLLSAALPEEAQRLRVESAARSARSALALGIASIPLALCLVGAPIGVIAVVVSFLARNAPPRGKKQAKVGRGLGITGIALTAGFMILASLTSPAENPNPDPTAPPKKVRFAQVTSATPGSPSPSASSEAPSPSPAAVSSPQPVPPSVAVAPNPNTTRAQPPAPTTNKAPTPAQAYYANCTEARAAGAAPLYRGEPGYRPALDRDGDGVACER